MTLAINSDLCNFHQGVILDKKDDSDNVSSVVGVLCDGSRLRQLLTSFDYSSRCIGAAVSTLKGLRRGVGGGRGHGWFDVHVRHRKSQEIA